MDRMACVDLPALPLQLLLRRRPEWRAHPAGVVEDDRAQAPLTWVNEAARRCHILPGMRRNAALSLARTLRVDTVDPQEIAAARAEILSALRFFTSGVEPSRAEPGVFWLDATGLSLLYPSLQHWAERIVEELRRRGLHAHVVVGTTRFGTYALARSGPGARCLRDETEEQDLARRVPLDRLALPPRVRDALLKLGVRRLGDFVDLPAAGIRRRFGEEAHRLHRLARGDLYAPLQPESEEEALAATETLDPAEREVDRLLAVVGRHLGTLRKVLRQRNRSLRRLHLYLRLENGSEREESLQPAEPTLDTAILLELLRLRLQGKPLDDAIEFLKIEIETARPSQTQSELFTALTDRDPAAAERALARLRALLGTGRIRCARLVDAHLPQARVRWEPFERLVEARPRSVHERPLVRRLLDRPVALPGHSRREPDGWMILGLEGGAVEEVVGPFVIEGGWWVREVRREIHYVRTASSGWLWVYYDRRRRRWFLQGAVE